jgi:inner membrane protein
MTGRTHDLASITALGFVAVLNGNTSMSLQTVIAAVFANLVGGILPDIDQPTAPFWRNLPIGSFFGKIFGKMSGGHRFLTHSILGVVGVGYLAHLFLLFVHPIVQSIDIGLVWRAFMIGVVSHISMDMFTKEGVPLFLPIPIKLGLPPIRKLRITTGKILETWVFFPALILLNLVFYTVFSAETIAILRGIVQS